MNNDVPSTCECSFENKGLQPLVIADTNATLEVKTKSENYYSSSSLRKAFEEKW